MFKILTLTIHSFVGKYIKSITAAKLVLAESSPAVFMRK